jgi:hypothetical protein
LNEGLRHDRVAEEPGRLTRGDTGQPGSVERSQSMEPALHGVQIVEFHHSS